MSTSQDFTLPAEWEEQAGILITWPHAHSDWSGNLSAIETLYLNLSRAICQYEKLLIIVYDNALKSHIESIFTQHNIDLSQVVFLIEKTNDTWTRDYGPISLTQNSRTRLLDFEFNGWGNKYEAKLDNNITQQLLSNQLIRPDESEKINLVLEGGSIESDGAGTLLTTTRCLLATSRNPALSKKEIEDTLTSSFGLKKILWLNHGYLAGDDTDSHVDVLARFTDINTIVYIKCNDITDEHYESSCKMENELQSFTNAKGEAYQLVTLPFPRAKYDNENRRLPASYANFLIINGAVLVPTYEDENDKLALSILQNCFKNRSVIGIPFNTAIQQNGSLHCLTMQIPAGML